MQCAITHLDTRSRSMLDGAIRICRKNRVVMRPYFEESRPMRKPMSRYGKHPERTETVSKNRGEHEHAIRY
jgi:hypothetical protein